MLACRFNNPLGGGTRGRRRISAFAALLLLPAAAMAAMQQDEYESPQLVLVSAPASYLGVNIRDIDEQSARMLDLKSTRGAEVIAVDHDAPAGKAGMHLRDVIVSVNGEAVTSAAQFRETMRGLPPGKEVALAVLRAGKAMKFTVKLADRVRLQQQVWEQHFRVRVPTLGSTFSSITSSDRYAQDDAENDVNDGPYAGPNSYFGIGAELDPIGPQLAGFFGVKDGTGLLVKSVEPGSAAAAAGLQAGDVVLKMNDDQVMTTVDWMRAVRASQGKASQLTIVRNKRVEVLTLAPIKTQA